MTRLQKLQLRQSELRTEMGGLLDKEDRSDEDRTNLSELSREMRGLEADIQAALLIEDEPETETRQTGAGENAERKELDGLLRRASILPFMGEAVSGREVQGVEHELRAGLLGDDARGGLVPFEMLLPPEREERADAATTVADTARTPGSQASVLQRVFTPKHRRAPDGVDADGRGRPGEFPGSVVRHHGSDEGGRRCAGCDGRDLHRGLS